MPPVTLETAKSIAAKYHGGEFSPLLAFVGHGRAYPSAIDEATEIMKRSTGAKFLEIAQLVSFLETNNEHAKQPPHNLPPADEDGGQFIKKMVDSYLETALWTEDFDEQTIFDFSPESRATAEKDCRAFATEAEAQEYEPEKVGHDFWLSRNGYGSGFFDAEYLNEDLATWWQKIAQKAGKSGVSIVDGRAYLESE